MTSASFTKSTSPVAGNLTMGGVLRSEWTKFRSLRSTWWLLIGTVLLAVGVGVVVIVLEVNTRRAASHEERVADLAESLTFTRRELAATAA